VSGAAACGGLLDLLKDLKLAEEQARLEKNTPKA
jgi:hypothetical protein